MMATATLVHIEPGPSRLCKDSGHRDSFRAFSILCLVLSTLLFLFTTITPVHAAEEEGYSVASLLPSFTSFTFLWRVYENKTNEIDKNEQVVYDVSAESDGKSSSLISQLDTPSPTKKTNRIDSSSLQEKMKPKKTFLANLKCQKCQKFDDVNEDEEYRQRIEFVKEKILTRLGLTEPPSLPDHPEVDVSLYMKMAGDTLISAQQRDFLINSMNEQAVDASEELDKVLMMPVRVTDKQPIFDVSNINTDRDRKHIHSIYIQVQYNMTVLKDNSLLNQLPDEADLLISQMAQDNNEILKEDSSNHGFVSTVSPMKQNNKNDDPSSWFLYEVTSLLGDYTNKKIQIRNENFDILSSVIMIYMSEHKSIRTKRSVDCTDRISYCCRQNFYVNFTAMGWNNWIYQPLGYNANYCKGKCDVSHARYHHTTVIGKYPAINLCCSPREMSPISLIYMDDNHNIHVKQLSDMVVESCDCA